MLFYFQGVGSSLQPSVRETSNGSIPKMPAAACPLAWLPQKVTLLFAGERSFMSEREREENKGRKIEREKIARKEKKKNKERILSPRRDRER